MSSAEQRQELADFLRSRRERRRPEDVGLAPGARRRTPGLRREEVATLAGLSVTWYTWLEQGRPIRGSRQVLGSLVGVLGLDEVETRHLFRLAGELPPDTPAVTPAATAAVPAPYAVLLDQLDPNPAFILDRRFDIVAWNRGCELLYTDVARFPAHRRNILWLMFTSDRLRATTDDWERDAAQTVALFRTQAGEDVLRPELAGLIAELQAESPDFARIWHRKDLAAFSSTARVFHHPALGPIELDYVKLHSPDAAHTVVAHLAPKNSALAARLAALLEGGCP
ncbi:helix-turn-helix transcriptional regulator [Actinacidiphila acididurans]|uniref:Helix-turn-helix domain-containing protein n=1 Tax=Actinacidiphila acididurans TaxID=2784346 RepID=A0ABS2TZ96_9ACTN|nr:helix-turn-helix transcriptional regulator [Actinacidiphila acididurans]MBM9508652.1 helix-turn-helix domain-containing protein [Actinacidiphila acididurans]